MYVTGKRISQALMPLIPLATIYNISPRNAVRDYRERSGMWEGP